MAQGNRRAAAEAAAKGGGGGGGRENGRVESVPSSFSLKSHVTRALCWGLIVQVPKRIRRLPFAENVVRTLVALGSLSAFHFRIVEFSNSRRHPRVESLVEEIRETRKRRVN